ncbi:MAG: hypothetical protein HGA67_03675 [Candidatus Yonathbacteria bacterium]|nr:hypothetical protein [Candidatus Yonathbacteria bacterium]
MSSSVYTRIGYGVTLLLSVLFLPWWVTLVLGIAGTIVFPRYVEIIVSGILLDFMYAAPHTSVPGLSIPAVHTLISIVMYAAIVFVKNRMR